MLVQAFRLILRGLYTLVNNIFWAIVLNISFLILFVVLLLLKILSYIPPLGGVFNHLFEYIRTILVEAKSFGLIAGSKHEPSVDKTLHPMTGCGEGKNHRVMKLRDRNDNKDCDASHLIFHFRGRNQSKNFYAEQYDHYRTFLMPNLNKDDVAERNTPSNKNA